ncbi:unnamed protein product [Rotaria sp. Silwood2]|nr:unnamed protein product [Rotaria sp. Silwood2]
MSRARYTVSMDALNPSQYDGQMPSTNAVAGGIDILRSISSLSIKQRPSVAEESTFCQRLWCASARRYTLHVMNNRQQEVMRIHREFTCCAGCCWCAYCSGCQQEVTIEAPPGQIIGTAKQNGSCWRMHYVLQDINTNVSLTILGPRCICDGALCCCCENKFTLLGSDGITEIGAIHKKYSGYCKEAFTSADNYSCEGKYI